VKTHFKPDTIWGVYGILMVAFAAFHGKFLLSSADPLSLQRFARNHARTPQSKSKRPSKEAREELKYADMKKFGRVLRATRKKFLQAY
jgi:hypothetical protein